MTAKSGIYLSISVFQPEGS